MVDEMAAGIAVVAVLAAVFLHLIVVNWSGDEVAQLEVEPSDTVMVGMRQIEEQLGVAVSRQRLVCGEDALEPVEMWSSYSNVRDWSTIQLTTLAQEFDADSDREALMAIFDSCGGVDWDRKANWGSAQPLSSWEGVLEVDEVGRVTKMSLRNSQLHGPIPPSIGNLRALRSLDLSGNQLTGAIPSEIGNLFSLATLRFEDNMLEGDIPHEFGNLTSLTRLDLSCNKLTGRIPPSICALTALTHLFLTGNELTGSIPPDLGHLAKLCYLTLNRNLLSGSIPPSIGNLRALRRLRLSHNFLSGAIPPEIGNLTALCQLELSGNQLNGAIPSSISNLPALQSLRSRC